MTALARNVRKPLRYFAGGIASVKCTGQPACTQNFPDRRYVFISTEIEILKSKIYSKRRQSFLYNKGIKGMENNKEKTANETCICIYVYVYECRRSYWHAKKLNCSESLTRV